MDYDHNHSTAPVSPGLQGEGETDRERLVHRYNRTTGEFIGHTWAAADIATSLWFGRFEVILGV